MKVSLNYIDTSSHKDSSTLSVYDRNMDQLCNDGPISQNIDGLLQLVPTKFRQQNGEKEPIDHSKQDSGAVRE